MSDADGRWPMAGEIEASLDSIPRNVPAAAAGLLGEEDRRRSGIRESTRNQPVDLTPVPVTVRELERLDTSDLGPRTSDHSSSDDATVMSCHGCAATRGLLRPLARARPRRAARLSARISRRCGGRASAHFRIEDALIRSIGSSSGRRAAAASCRSNTCSRAPARRDADRARRPPRGPRQSESAARSPNMADSRQSLATDRRLSPPLWRPRGRRRNAAGDRGTRRRRAFASRRCSGVTC